MNTENEKMRFRTWQRRVNLLAFPIIVLYLLAVQLIDFDSSTKFILQITIGFIVLIIYILRAYLHYRISGSFSGFYFLALLLLACAAIAVYYTYWQ